jgi:Zn finger protein HypA/HybF involved in hydrogenase expression
VSEEVEMNNECVSCGRTAAAGTVRCASCGGVKFRIVRSAGFNVERGHAAKAPAGQVTPKCAACGARLASETSTCAECGARPARALSDSELLDDLKRMVSRPRPTAEQERADAARAADRKFAMSRGGLVDLDRPAPVPRRGAWLQGPMGPTFVPAPSVSGARGVDRVTEQFERVEAGMRSYRGGW